MTIFLSISSYKDPLLINTLQSAYKNAKNKDSIIFAVVDQNDQNHALSYDRKTENLKHLIFYIGLPVTQDHW